MELEPSVCAGLAQAGEGATSVVSEGPRLCDSTGVEKRHDSESG